MATRKISPSPVGFIDFSYQVKSKLKKINAELEAINAQTYISPVVTQANALYHGKYVSTAAVKKILVSSSKVIFYFSTCCIATSWNTGIPMFKAFFNGIVSNSRLLWNSTGR